MHIGYRILRGCEANCTFISKCIDFISLKQVDIDHLTNIKLINFPWSNIFSWNKTWPLWFETTSLSRAHPIRHQQADLSANICIFKQPTYEKFKCKQETNKNKRKKTLKTLKTSWRDPSLAKRKWIIYELFWNKTRLILKMQDIIKER